MRNLVQIDNRMKELRNMIRQKNQALKSAPEGFIKAVKHGKGVQYYLTKKETGKQKTYLRKQEIDIARRIAQRDYDQAVLRASKEELAVWEAFQKNFPPKTIEDIYDALHPNRQALVFPIEEPLSSYQKEWEEKEYEKKSFHADAPDYVTDKGVRVRSKSELMIANMLTRNGIAYRYEYPIYLDGMGIIHPDFTVLHPGQRKEILWEHLGMMDDEEYASHAVQRIIRYMMNGYFVGENLVLTFETSTLPLSSRILEKTIQHWFLDEAGVHS